MKSKRRDIEGRDIVGRDSKRRVTPELIDFHIKRAHRLRKESFRNTGRAIAAWLVNCRMGRAKRLGKNFFPEFDLLDSRSLYDSFHDESQL